MNKTIATESGKKTALENTKADTFRRQLRLRAQDDGDYSSLIQHLCPHDQEVYFRAKWDGRTLDLTEIPKPTAIEQRVEQPAAQTTKEQPNASRVQTKTDANPAEGGPVRSVPEDKPGEVHHAANVQGDAAGQVSPAIPDDGELDAILQLDKPQRDAELKTLAPTRGVKWDGKASIETMIEKIRKAKK